jgi:hypothetical protein
VIEKMTRETFAPLVGQELTLHASPDVAVPVRLTAVEGRGVVPLPIAEQSRRHEQFSVYFLGPREPRLPQRTYALEHPTLGRFELFLVPVGEDAAGRVYEAAFT